MVFVYRKYKIVFNVSYIALETEVNELLQLGWEVSGGMAVGLPGYFQAMTKDTHAE